MDFLISSAYAQAAPGAAAPNPLMSFLPLIIIFGIFYFLLLAPMRKRQKAHAKLISELKRGDRVVTNGGLIGEIAAVEAELAAGAVGVKV